MVFLSGFDRICGRKEVVFRHAAIRELRWVLLPQRSGIREEIVRQEQIRRTANAVTLGEAGNANRSGR